MIQWGDRSRRNIDQLCEPLQSVLEVYAEQAPRSMDLTITVGHRDQATQAKAFARGRSKVQWPGSKHNKTPSEAFDFVPSPLLTADWKDSLRFARIAGALLWVAQSRGIELRWGGDWDQDGKSNDQRFMDLGHMEIVT